MEIKTLMDYPWEDVRRILAHPLPPRFYKKAEKYTDIHPVARQIIMTMLFGPAGIGWTMEVLNAKTVEYTKTTGSGDRQWGRTTMTLSLRICWDIDGKRAWGEPIQVPVAWEQNDLKYVPKGAVTYGVGVALSFMGFQAAVYQGRLNHKNAATWYERVGPHPFEDELSRAFIEKAEEESKPPKEKAEESRQPEEPKQPVPELVVVAKQEAPPTAPPKEKAEEVVRGRFKTPVRTPDIGGLEVARAFRVGSVTIGEIYDRNPKAVRAFYGHQDDALSNAAIVVYRMSNWAWGNVDKVADKMERAGKNVGLPMNKGRFLELLDQRLRREWGNTMSTVSHVCDWDILSQDQFMVKIFNPVKNYKGG